jgi:hypothetical protein
MMHKLDHTPFVVKQIIELLTPSLSTNIGLEANYRSNVPQNVPILYGHVS